MMSYWSATLVEGPRYGLKRDVFFAVDFDNKLV